jgi:hypothetical protein
VRLIIQKMKQGYTVQEGTDAPLPYHECYAFSTIPDAMAFMCRKMHEASEGEEEEENFYKRLYDTKTGKVV